MISEKIEVEGCTGWVCGCESVVWWGIRGCEFIGGEGCPCGTWKEVLDIGCEGVEK